MNLLTELLKNAPAALYLAGILLLVLSAIGQVSSKWLRLDVTRQQRIGLALIGLLSVGLGYLSESMNLKKGTEPPPIPAPEQQLRTNDEDCAALDSGHQICWGTRELPTLGNKAHRLFGFKFAKPFAGKPTITNAINVKSGTFAFAVYNHDLTENAYSGQVVEIDLRRNDVFVSMSYIAVGRPGGRD